MPRLVVANLFCWWLRVVGSRDGTVVKLKFMRVFGCEDWLRRLGVGEGILITKNVRRWNLIAITKLEGMLLSFRRPEGRCPCSFRNLWGAQASLLSLIFSGFWFAIVIRRCFCPFETLQLLFVLDSKSGFIKAVDILELFYFGTYILSILSYHLQIPRHFLFLGMVTHTGSHAYLYACGCTKSTLAGFDKIYRNQTQCNHRQIILCLFWKDANRNIFTSFF